jgi:NADH dehydrogenase/NADH:ubiquinone oxidoreductase subunit G
MGHAIKVLDPFISVVEENIDLDGSKLFENKDEVLRSTPYFSYLVAQTALVQAGEAIKDSKDETYYRTREALVNNTAEIEKIQDEYQNKYGDLINKASKEQSKWKEDHRELYEEQETFAVESRADYVPAISKLVHDIKIEQIVQLYKASREFVNNDENYQQLSNYKVRKVHLAPLPDEVEHINSEYKKIWEKYEIPDKPDVSHIEKISGIAGRISLNRQKCSDFGPAIDVTKEATELLLDFQLNG